MKQNVSEFIQGKSFAIVGVSRAGNKFGNSIYQELKARGYQVTIVHPEAKEIGGEPCVSTLAETAGKVDGVIICVKPEQAKQALREAVQAGMTKIWLQQGSHTAETLAYAKELGVDPVSGKCILMYMQPVGSVHGFHRAVVKIFGGL